MTQQPDLWRDLRDYVRMTATGPNKSLFVIGEGGTGKTRVTLDTLREGGHEFFHMTTFSTPLELYSYLCIHRDKIIVLDDLDGILDNKKSISILKSCLWGYGPNRVVQYLSSSALLTVEPRFEFTGRMIFLLNEFPKNKFVASLITRSVYYELRIPYALKIQMMEQIAHEPYGGMTEAQRLEVYNFIRLNSSEATQELNLRTLIKAFNMFIYSQDRWMDLVRLMLKPDDDMATLRSIEDTVGDLTVFQKCRLFMTQTGKSRRTYFRLKRKMQTR